MDMDLEPMPLHRFKSAVKDGHRMPAVKLFKGVTMGVEPLDDRRVRFIISTASVDRDNDTVAVDGWKLDTFKTNPVVLWGHNSRELPIGRCCAIGVEGGALKAEVEFAPADMPIVGDRAEATLRMCRSGFLSATSVGFIPISYELAKDRMDDDDWFAPVNFTRQELIEFSLCSIPSNPDCLIEPGQRGRPDAAAASLDPAAAERAAVKRLQAIEARNRAIRATAYH